MSSSLKLFSSDESSDEEIVLEIVMRLPKPRVVRDRYNPLNNFDDLEFKYRFRLSKHTFVILLHMIEDEIMHQTSRNNAISPVNQLLVALQYYATGAFQVSMGDLTHIHKSIVLRIIKRVSLAIALLHPHFIKMPTSTNEQHAIQLGFYSIRGFPRVIGAIDCTHIRIQSPNSDIGEQFRNRKGYFSINVQAVCTSNLVITNLVVKWPGSVHDSIIFDNSILRAQFENNEFGISVLLGDRGYPCRSYLLTPLLNPRSESERRYQKAHKETRNVIKRLFGIWKRRFPVLAIGLCTKEDTTIMATIVATAVLHNLLIQENDVMPPEDIVDDQELFQEIKTLPIARQNEIGNTVRKNLINTVFHN